MTFGSTGGVRRGTRSSAPRAPTSQTRSRKRSSERTDKPLIFAVLLSESAVPASEMSIASSALARLTLTAAAFWLFANRLSPLRSSSSSLM